MRRTTGWHTRWTGRWTAAVGVALLVLAGFAVALATAGGDGGVSSSAVSSEIGSAEPARARSDEGVAADAVAGSIPAEPAQGVPVGAVERSLVRTAQVTVEVADPVVGVRDVRAAAVAAGGFVAQEQSGENSGWVVLRVPADALDRLVEQVSAFGSVTDRSSTVVDATEEAVDLDARVRSQEASVSRVRALLAEATSIGDIVAIESELARREAELDSLTGRLTALRDQVAFSTLTVDLRGPGGALGDEEPGPVGFLEGLAAGWDGLLAVGAGTGAVLGFVLPFLPLIIVLALLGRLATRLVRGRRAPAPPAADPA